MPSLQELIEQIKSSRPIDRISARISLLRQFPQNGDSKIKSKMYSDLTKDVEGNSDVAMGYAFGLEDLQEEAYAVMAIAHYIPPRRLPNSTPEEDRNRRIKRAPFIKRVSGLVGKLEEINDLSVRLEVAETIAREGEKEPAMVAVDKIWGIGWKAYLRTHLSVLSNIWEGDTSVVGTLKTISEWAYVSDVKKHAINYIGQIPDERERRKILTDLLTSNKEETALMALDVFMERAGHPTENKASLAFSAIMAHPSYDPKGVANPAVIRKAFDIYIDDIEPSRRFDMASTFIREQVKANASLSNSCFGHPRELIRKAAEYIESHIDELARIENPDLGEEIAMCLLRAHFGNAVQDRALDYLAAPGGDEKRGVLNIAQLYSNSRLSFGLSDTTKKRIMQQAFKYIRKFADLEDKEAARAALMEIGGDPARVKDEDFDDDISPRFYDGELHKEPGTERPYLKIAHEELARLPRVLTEDEKLAAVFNPGV